MEKVRYWCSFCRKNSMEQLCGVYENTFIPTMISSCELCGSTIDCVIQAKEKEFYLANSK